MFSDHHQDSTETTWGIKGLPKVSHPTQYKGSWGSRVVVRGKFVSVGLRLGNVGRR